jgi:hypothetical protein
MQRALCGHDCEMFHQIGSRVQGFFPRVCRSDCLDTEMDRTHSIMRIATTASLVSGADVRERMEVLLPLDQNCQPNSCNNISSIVAVTRT